MVLLCITSKEKAPLRKPVDWMPQVSEEEEDLTVDFCDVSSNVLS